MIIVRTISPLHPSVSYPDANDFFVREDGYLEVLTTTTGGEASVTDILGLHAPGTWEYVRTVNDES